MTSHASILHTSKLGSALATLAILSFVGLAPSHAAWQPAKGPLVTQWAKNVTPSNVLPEYPRP